MNRGAPLITTEHHSPSLNEEMIAKFDNDFQSILEGDLSDTVAALARVVDGVTDQTSSKLWRMMCGELDFFKYLFAARSVYLMGKGEMTQCILDHLFSNSWNPHMTVDAMSKSLSNEVLPSVMKLVGVEDDESVSGTLRLTVSTNSLRIERWDEFDQQSVALAGSADFTVDGLDVVETASHRAKMFLPSGVNLCALRRVPEAVVEIMMSKSYLFDGGLQSVQLEPSELGNKVINGALWLQDVRNVNKGWRLAAEFSLPWMASLKSIASKVALADADSEIVLGTVALCVHNDSRGVDAIGCNVMLGGLSNALKATAMFCGKAIVLMSSLPTLITVVRTAKAAGRGKIRQYVRLILSHTMEHGLPAMLRTQPSSQDIQEIVLGEETIDLSGKDRYSKFSHGNALDFIH